MFAVNTAYLPLPPGVTYEGVIRNQICLPCVTSFLTPGNSTYQQYCFALHLDVGCLEALRVHFLQELLIMIHTVH